MAIGPTTTTAPDLPPANLAEQLKRDEGLRLHPYSDTVGKVTIGIGRNLTDVGISAEEADYLLQNDIFRAQRDLRMRFPWVSGMSDVRRAVLENMTFNMGIAGLEKFHKMLLAAASGDWEEAAAEMLDSLWATQVGKEPGQRAWRLAEQMRTGEWV